MPRTAKGIKKAPKRHYIPKGKKCQFTEQKIEYIDYKDVEILQHFVSKATGEILPRRRTGTSAKMQRKLAKAIKQAREVGLMPFVRSYN
jgi:small subunit ribosomal protein S18